MHGKLLVLACFVLAAHIAEAIYLDYNSARMRWDGVRMCMKDAEIDLEDLDTYVKGTEPDRRLKCYASCMSKKRGTLNKDGTLNVERFIDFLPADLPEHESVIEDINICADITHDDECEMAHQIFTCLAEKNHVGATCINVHAKNSTNVKEPPNENFIRKIEDKNKQEYDRLF